ncbi:hypothetical protein KIPB_009969, partial [Kipferlia bialata]|eukprot:g9969.t1
MADKYPNEPLSLSVYVQELAQQLGLARGTLQGVLACHSSMDTPEADLTPVYAPLAKGASGQTGQTGERDRDTRGRSRAGSVASASASAIAHRPRSLDRVTRTELLRLECVRILSGVTVAQRDLLLEVLSLHGSGAEAEAEAVNPFYRHRVGPSGLTLDTELKSFIGLDRERETKLQREASLAEARARERRLNARGAQADREREEWKRKERERERYEAFLGVVRYLHTRPTEAGPLYMGDLGGSGTSGPSLAGVDSLNLHPRYREGTAGAEFDRYYARLLLHLHGNSGSPTLRTHTPSHSSAHPQALCAVQLTGPSFDQEPLPFCESLLPPVLGADMPMHTGISGTDKGTHAPRESGCLTLAVVESQPVLVTGLAVYTQPGCPAPSLSVRVSPTLDGLQTAPPVQYSRTVSGARTGRTDLILNEGSEGEAVSDQRGHVFVAIQVPSDETSPSSPISRVILYGHTVHRHHTVDDSPYDSEASHESVREVRGQRGRGREGAQRHALSHLSDMGEDRERESQMEAERPGTLVLCPSDIQANDRNTVHDKEREREALQERERERGVVHSIDVCTVMREEVPDEKQPRRSKTTVMHTETHPHTYHVHRVCVTKIPVSLYNSLGSINLVYLDPQPDTSLMPQGGLLRRLMTRKKTKEKEREREWLVEGNVYCQPVRQISLPVRTIDTGTCGLMRRGESAQTACVSVCFPVPGRDVT